MFGDYFIFCWNSFIYRCLFQKYTSNWIQLFPCEHSETEPHTDIEEGQFAVEVEEVPKDVEDQVEDTDWAPHEDSTPSTEDYNSQSGEEFDGLNSSSTVR